MSRSVVLQNKFIPSDFLPIGFLGYIPYSDIPAGWLVCDGTIYSVTDYPELFVKLGNVYGGDGVTTFAVPDDRGLFRRGLDLSKGIDPGRVLGSFEDQDVQPHSHSQPAITSSTVPGGSFIVPFAGGTANTTSNVNNSTGTETRPKNRAYIPIIKAKNIYYDMTIQGGNAASLGGNPASYYAAASQVVKNVDFTGSFAANGYQKFPSGLILQWGKVTSGGALVTVTFPIAFPSVCYGVYVQGTSDYSYTTQACSITTTNFGISARNSQNNAYSADNILDWFSVGK